MVSKTRRLIILKRTLKGNRINIAQTISVQSKNSNFRDAILKFYPFGNRLADTLSMSDVSTNVLAEA